jgi:hypothetical protein
MKTIGEDVGRRVKTLFVACAVVGSATAVPAQDATVTSFDQLAQVALSANYSLYLPFSPWDWRAYPTDWPLWCDFTEMACLDSLPTSTNFMTSIEWCNVPLASVILTKNVLSGVTTLESSDSTDVLATIAAPSGYQPGVASEDRWLWNWYVQATNNPDWWGLTPGQIPPPTITLRTFLANSNAYYSVYESNIEAEAAAQAAATVNATSVVADFMAMDEEDDVGGDPCTITNEAVPFSIVSLTPDGGGSMVLQWQSCTDHVYIVQTASALPAMSWTDVAWMFGADQQTSWTDTNAVGLTQNFYQVVRANPNTLNNGIPYGWAVTYGLDPLDPNLASETSTNPWAHGLTNLQVYENPSVLIADNYSTEGDGIPDWWKVMYGLSLTDPNLANENPAGDGWSNLEKYLYNMNPLVYYGAFDFIVNGGQPYTTSLTVSIQPTSTNFPNFLVGQDPTMSNATLLANSGAPINYTLPNNGDGAYVLFLQYADAQGQPHGALVSGVVTLDTTPPVVFITSPASNAVLNQAFITLQAVVADPNPVLPDAVRPLSISINGQAHWDRAGTNILIERFPVPAGTNSFTVTILAVDLAGNTNTASQTWPVDLSTATNAPNMLTVNLTSSMTLPNVDSIWVEGTVDNDYALINAIVFDASGDVTTNLLNVRQNQYEGLVPVSSGTNQLVLVASDAAGNATSNAYTIISSTEFNGAITNPVFGAFATAPSNYVSGYVSALYDAGLPTQTNVTTVTVNGVAAVLGTNVDAFGNIPFWTTNMIPLGVPIFATVGGPGIPTDPPTLPPAMSQGYEVTHKETFTEDFWPGEGRGLPYGDLRRDVGSPCWNAAISLSLQWRTADVLADATQVSVQQTNQSGSLYDNGFICVTTLNPDELPWHMYQPWVESSNEPGPESRALSFGLYSYTHGAGSGSDTYNMGWLSCQMSQETFPYGEAYLERHRADGWLRFCAPRQYGTNTTVIFTFEGVDYRRQQGMPLDLSQVKFRGQEPIAYSNETQTVSYLLAVDGGCEYTICQDDFTWPADQQPGHYANSWVNPSAGPCYFYVADSFAGSWAEDMHFLSWTDFHNALPQIIGPTNLVSTVNAAGSNVTLTASNYPAGGTYDWSTTSGNISLVGPTTGQAVVVSPKPGLFTPTGAVEVVTLTYTSSSGDVITSTFNIVVQHPTSVRMISSDAELQGNRVSLGVRYQILDQNNQPLRCVIQVGSTQVRLATLLASEVLAWQCNTSCGSAQGDATDIGVADDGTFADTQSALGSCVSYTRSQTLYVGILKYKSQDVVGYKCICFNGKSEFTIATGTADGTACCTTCLTSGQ